MHVIFMEEIKPADSVLIASPAAATMFEAGVLALVHMANEEACSSITAEYTSPDLGILSRGLLNVNFAITIVAGNIRRFSAIRWHES